MTRRAPLALLAFRALVAFVGPAAADERGTAHASLQFYVQPAPSDALFIITPVVSGEAAALRWLKFDVSWSADVVTGATPRTYGRPDVVTAATRFSEFRNTLGVGASAAAGPVTISAGYACGTANDYRSHLLRVGAVVDLLQHNTILAANYDHSINRICDLDQGNIPLLLRQPLDSSRGCFAATPGLTEESLDVDTVELSATQTVTRSLIASLVGSYQHLSGFQSSPYRRVRLFEGEFQAQESHPRTRDRGAITARVRYAIERLHATLGGDLRLYGDTWGIKAITGEASWQQPFGRQSNWRFVARLRGYVQSGASFYRDAGEANSYEIAGPAGNYFTADQELAPLADLFVGGRFLYAAKRPAGQRFIRMFTEGEVALFLDYMKIFALTPEPPNAPRTRGFVSALLLGASVTGHF